MFRQIVTSCCPVTSKYWLHDFRQCPDIICNSPLSKIPKYSLFVLPKFCISIVLFLLSWDLQRILSLYIARWSDLLLSKHAPHLQTFRAISPTPWRRSKINHALAIIPPGISYEPPISTTGLTTLEERRAALCTRFIQRVYKTSPLYNLIKDQHCRTTYQYRLRAVIPKIKRCNTDRFKQFVTVKYGHHLMCNWTEFTYMYI